MVNVGVVHHRIRAAGTDAQGVQVGDDPVTGEPGPRLVHEAREEVERVTNPGGRVRRQVERQVGERIHVEVPQRATP